MRDRIRTSEINIPWLTDIPDRWGIARSKRFFIARKDTARPGDQQLSATQAYGVIAQKEFERRVGRKVTQITRHLEKRRHVERDDFVISMRSFQGGLERAWESGCIRSSYVVLKPSAEIHVGYFARLFKSHDYIQALRATANFIRDGQDLNFNNFCLVDLPVVPMEEQRAIAKFLDHVDRRIRRYIRAKRQLIVLLNEQKQAIIRHAVTRGLDPNVRFKPSGVEWLGDVPQHWDVKRLKWVTRLQRGYDLPQDKRISGPFPVVSSGGIIDTHHESRCKGPGVVMGRYGSTDAVYYVADDYWPHNTSLFVTDFQGNLPRWCYYLLQTISKADHAGKSAVPGVDRKDLFDIEVVAPPSEEQQEIVTALESDLSQVDVAICSANRELDCMHEYRTRLIADVVTGKLDVREAAARLPVEAEEAEVPADELLAGEDVTDDAQPDTEPEDVEI